MEMTVGGFDLRADDSKIASIVKDLRSIPKIVDAIERLTNPTSFDDAVLALKELIDLVAPLVAPFVTIVPKPTAPNPEVEGFTGPLDRITSIDLEKLKKLLPVILQIVQVVLLFAEPKPKDE